MLFASRCFLRCVLLTVLIVVGASATLSRRVCADTNVVTSGAWIVDGTDDTGTNPVSIAMSAKKKAIGSFSELLISYNSGGTGVVDVCTIKGNGEIRLALLPPGEFGGAFYMTGYWDCDEGFVPAMMITQLEVRVQGGQHGAVELRGRITNGTSMEAKDFLMKLSPPGAKLTRADVSYNLYATRDICVDQTTRTNADDFLAVRMAANYLSPDVQENDQARYVKITQKVCVSFVCVTKKKSFCDDLVNEDGYIVGSPVSLRGGVLYLVHRQPVPRDTPTLQVKFTRPSSSSVKPQGFVTASADPAAQNVSLWANWSDAKPSYRKGKKISKFRYSLQVAPANTSSCDQEN